MSSARPSPGGRFPGLRALRRREFRLWLTSHGVSFAGTWMARVALGWLVFRLTNSSLWLGLITFASGIPALFLSPAAGVLADRMPLRKLLAATGTGLGLLALGMGVLVAQGLVTTWVVLGFALGLGLLSAFDTPARQTFVLELAGPEDLSSAVALGSAVVNVARIVGPAAAGFVVGHVGEAPAFFIDGISFFVPVAVVLWIRPPHERQLRSREKPLTALRAGFRYAARAPHTRAVLPLVAIGSLIGFPFLPLLPAFAGEVLGGGPVLLGWLNVAVGVGSVVGALSVGSIVDHPRLPRRMAVGTLALGAGLVGLGLSRWVPLTLAVLPLAGYGFATLLAASSTFLQLATPDAMRGRVIASYTQTLLGLFPIGALLLGSTSELVGVGPAVAASGVGIVGAGLLFATRVDRLTEAVARAEADEAEAAGG